MFSAATNISFEVAGKSGSILIVGKGLLFEYTATYAGAELPEENTVLHNAALDVRKKKGVHCVYT
jgi:hypothetical protein